MQSFVQWYAHQYQDRLVTHGVNTLREQGQRKNLQHLVPAMEQRIRKCQRAQNPCECQFMDLMQMCSALGPGFETVHPVWWMCQAVSA